MPAARWKVAALFVFLAPLAFACPSAGGGVELRIDVLDAKGQHQRTFGAGSPVHFAAELANAGETAVSLPFMSAKTFDAVVLAADGKEVWRLSQGRMYAQVVSSLDLAPGGTQLFQGACDPAQGGPKLAPGSYQVIGIVPAAGAELRSAPVAFEVAAD